MTPDRLSFLVIVAGFFLRFSLCGFFLVCSYRSVKDRLLDDIPYTGVGSHLLPIGFLFMGSPTLQIMSAG